MQKVTKLCVFVFLKLELTALLRSIFFTLDT